MTFWPAVIVGYLDGESALPERRNFVVPPWALSASPMGGENCQPVVAGGVVGACAGITLLECGVGCVVVRCESVGDEDCVDVD